MAAATVAALVGCASSTRTATHRWWPSTDQWRAALSEAARDPRTWVSAAGAAAVAAGGWDRQISEWAVRTAPVFGSPARAESATTALRTASHVFMLGSALAVPADASPWGERLERMLVEEGAVATNASVVKALKRATGRERPDGSDDSSFPSGHGAQAFAYAAMSSRNLEAIPLSRPWKTGLNVASITLAGGAAWGRVEAGVHYPTDILAGAAVGNFLAVLIHDAFLDLPHPPVVSFGLTPAGVVMKVSLRLAP